MSNDSQPPRRLPDRPNLRHLKAQARDLLKAGTATSISDAQFHIARLYGFASWPKLRAHMRLLQRNRSRVRGVRFRRISRGPPEGGHYVHVGPALEVHLQTDGEQPACLYRPVARRHLSLSAPRRQG